MSVRCWSGNVAKWGGGGRDWQWLPSSRRKDAYCRFNNFPYCHVYFINYLPLYWSPCDHRGLHAQQKNTQFKSLLTCLWLSMSSSGSLHLSSQSKHPESSVFAESCQLNIHVELHNNRISHSSGTFGRGWSAAAELEWHPPLSGTHTGSDELGVGGMRGSCSVLC